MAETTTGHEKVSDPPTNNKNHEFNTNRSDNSQHNTDSPSILKTSMQTETNHSAVNQSSDDMSHPMSRLSMHSNQPRQTANVFYAKQTSSSPQFTSPMHPHDTQAQLVAFTPPLMSLRLPYRDNQLRPRSYHSARPYRPNQQPFLPPRNKLETMESQPEYYVDSFSSNFANKPSSNSNNNNKPKVKHVTFQEPDTTNELSRTHSDNTVFLPATSSANAFNYPYQNWRPAAVPMYPYPSYRYESSNNYYQNNEFYPQYPNMMINPQFMPRPRGMNTMSTSPVWRPQPYHLNQQTPYFLPPSRPRQLYDPNRPRIPMTNESHDSSKVLRHIVPKNKKKTNQTNSDDSFTVSTSEPFSHPITILRKPSIDPEITSPPVENQPAISFKEEERPVTPPKEEEERPVTPPKEEEQPVTSPKEEEQPAIASPQVEHTTTTPEAERSLSPPITSSDIPSEMEQTTITSADTPSESNSSESWPSHELLSILQSANCISSLNEYAQQKKFLLNYEFSSTSPSIFTCIISINGRQFSTSPPCSSKTEAQKLACDQAVRTLYRESCPIKQSTLEFSSKHDYIAHRSVSTFQDLNVNELLLGRKTLACMLMITDQQFAQAQVISIATGNCCLDETNLSYADDGTALHDCHAEILARRGLIKYLLEQIKQSKEQNSSIFNYNSTLNKHQLRDNITFHMYISSLPCGNASLNISSNSIRYKQGQTEGTSLASTSSMKYPIKSCSDKIYRWNILGIQGGLLINFLTKPIYLQSITIACETKFDRTRVNYSLAEHLKEHFHSLPSPYLLHMPDIDCPTIKSFQQERQVAKLQMNAFAWNITQSNRTELLEPMTGRLKNNRSISSLSKQNLLRDYLNILQDNSLTYQQAKQGDQTYIMVKNLISTAFQEKCSDESLSWISKSDQLERFTIQ